MIYLLNSPVLTACGDWRLSGPLSPQEARARLHGQTVRSAIGHAGSAQLLERLLGQPVAVQRLTARMEPGDAALVLRLLQRLPEGVLLDDEELQRTPFELAWLERLDDPAAVARAEPKRAA